MPMVQKSQKWINRENYKIILVCGIWFNVFMFCPGDNNGFWDTVIAFSAATVIAGIVAIVLDYFTKEL